MKCPFCGTWDSRVVDSRPTEEGAAIRRRRECTECQKRFTTYEKLDEIPLVVVKRDGRREVFSRAKILTGLLKSCEKRYIPVETLERLVSDVERELRNSLRQEVDSVLIGEMVMERLKDVDAVAYVRFASVYRHFEDVGKFMLELEKLLERQTSRG